MLEDVSNVAVIGAGTMGPGLAQVFASAGMQVRLYSRSHETLEQARTVARANLDTFVRHGLLTGEDASATLDRIRLTRSLAEAGEQAGLVVEAVAEDPDVKRDVFAQLDRVCLPEAVFASTTSYLDIFGLVPDRRLPATVIAHWFAPPQIVPLVEVVSGPGTDDATTGQVVALLERLGKVPVVLEKFVPGFCINRLLRIIGHEVFFLLDNGYMTPESLDRAVKASIVPRAMVLGFAQRYDFTGLDLSLRNLQNSEFEEAPVDNAPRSLVERVERGELGVKSGKGFYDYSGHELAEVLGRRDAALIDVFAKTGDLIERCV
jgi:3-hydroxybutyryl-CoA dehydrogenase